MNRTCVLRCAARESISKAEKKKLTAKEEQRGVREKSDGLEGMWRGREMKQFVFENEEKSKTQMRFCELYSLLHVTLCCYTMIK